MKNSIYLLLISLILNGCAPVSFIGSPIREINQDLFKKENLSETNLQKWHLLDLEMDSVPGMSVERAYRELIKDKKGENIIVAIVDSGVDIEHPALENRIWTNENEIPNNNIDDDGNGYIDDIHGWNFLGEGDQENLEYIRILKKEKVGSSRYKKLDKRRQNDLKKAKEQMEQISFILEKIPQTDSILSAATEKTDFTIGDVKALPSKSIEVMEAIRFFSFLTENGLNKSKLEKYKKSLLSEVEAYYNLDFDGRKIVGDDPDDFNDQFYGNNNVIGPNKDSADHGTHVSGLVGAEKVNNHASHGVAENVKIMVLRAVPDGDEYDKDIALAIRYAVDNGAKIINSSFGKGFSPHQDWVTDALIHAAKNDVLVVNAAGNDGNDIDSSSSPTFMTDTVDGKEVVDNFITVGASTRSFNSEQVASFSNVGMQNVDVFAPGEEISSTVPFGIYEAFDGTSMAAPNVSGVAAVLRSFYPKYPAKKIKSIIINSGIPLHNPIKNPESGKLVNANKLSKSGKLVNLYNALLHASSKK